MTFPRPVAILIALLAALPACAAQGGGRARAGSVRPQAMPRAQAQQARVQNHPGEDIIRRLSSMTPEQLEQSLSKLPPAQRANIERRIENFKKLPPAAQQRTLARLDKLNSLPPKEQQQVRRSIRDFNGLQQDRKMAINRGLRAMSTMSEADRQAFLKSPGFRSGYSKDEQRIIGHLAEIEPATP